jgi:hypothetical protein
MALANSLSSRLLCGPGNFFIVVLVLHVLKMSHLFIPQARLTLPEVPAILPGTCEPLHGVGGRDGKIFTRLGMFASRLNAATVGQNTAVVAPEQNEQ